MDACMYVCTYVPSMHDYQWELVKLPARDCHQKHSKKGLSMHHVTRVSKVD